MVLKCVVPSTTDGGGSGLGARPRPVGDKGSATREKIRSICFASLNYKFALQTLSKRATAYATEATIFSSGTFKSHPRNQKRFHSRYNFGYGILLYIRKMPLFCPLTAHFGGSRGIFFIKPINPPSSAPVRQKWRILYV